MDEVSLHAPTQVAELRNGKITRYQLTPSDFGLRPCAITDLEGGTPEVNRQLLADLLQGEGKRAHTESVAANVALLMRLHGQEDLKMNTEVAMHAIYSGKAINRVTALAARG